MTHKKPKKENFPDWLVLIPSAVSLSRGVATGEPRRLPTANDVAQGADPKSWLYPADERGFVARCFEDGFAISVYDNHLDHVSSLDDAESKEAVPVFKEWRRRAKQALADENEEAFAGWITAMHITIDYAALYGLTRPAVHSWGRLKEGPSLRQSTRRTNAFKEWVKEHGPVAQLKDLCSVPRDNLSDDVRVFIWGDSSTIPPASLAAIRKAYKEVWPKPMKPGRPKS